MFFVEEKLSERIRELSEYRYRDAIVLSELRFSLDSGQVGRRPTEGGEWSIVRLGDQWQGRDVYAWVAVDVPIPALWQGKTVVGRFDFGSTGHGHNSGFESLLYIDDQVYQGVDTNHQEVFFPPELIGQMARLRFRLLSGLEGGGQPRIQEHKFRRAEIAWLDEATDDLYFTSEAVLQTVKLLDENRPERQRLLTALDRAFLELDWSYPGSQDFYESVVAGNQRLQDELAQMPHRHPVTVHCIGHAHIDVAWLWRLRHTREKAARTFATALRLMERYPEYTFIQTQPQLYDYIRGDYPEIYEQIRPRVEEGRWEAEGGMWLEPDCNIPSGESLVRQLLLGTRFFREEFGVECTYLWLPDVFGYSWALPQILKKSGIETLMTTKISWNQYNRMPHDTFNWRGMDGSEILVHFITTPSPSRIYTYNGVITPRTVQGIWDAYQDKVMNQDLLLAYGYGDGGGGVNREMLEMRRRLETMPGLPRVVTGRATDYFEALKDTVAGTDQYVHTWDGELYLEIHRGTYTSQAYSKRTNRKLELSLRETEWLGVLGSLSRADWRVYPQAELSEAWKILLRHQFHDILPGSSIREVYEDSQVEYAEAESLVQEAWQHVAGDTQDAGNWFTVLNSSSWNRADYLRVRSGAGGEEGVWFDAADRELRAQRSGDDWIVYVSDLPSMGLGSVRFEPGHQANRPDSPFVVHDSGVTTPYYLIAWNAVGQLTEIYSRTAERQILEPGKCGNVLQVFEDKPLHGKDGWGLELYYQEKMRVVDDLVSVTVREDGPLALSVQFEWRYAGSTITQDLVLYAHSPRIDFRTHVDWNVRRQMMKVAFPVNIRATEATYDIQFGNIKRPTHWNTSWDYARFEVLGHQWADLSERAYGVSLLNDCKYGYDIFSNVMRLTLLKSPIFPDTEGDQGHHEFTYALLPHEGDWYEGNTHREAWDLNNPLCALPLRPSRPDCSLFHLSIDHVTIDAVKKSEDADRVVLRVHEFAGARGTVDISSDFSIRSWQECDLMERPIDHIQRDSPMSFQITPYEIKTFLIEMQQ